MTEQRAESGLYYFDAELVSEGSSDDYNIAAGQQLTVEGYHSDGYYLTTDDTNLTFSVLERPKLVVSKSILDPGVDDSPENATSLVGQNIQVTYDRSQLVEDVQTYMSSEVDRTICASLLARHLIPHFVRFDMVYTGGSREDIVIPEEEEYISNLLPSDSLESSMVQKIAQNRGASYIRNPIDLIAVVHNIDRSIWVERSQDALSTGRLADFIPDLLIISRNLT
jgi:hypothetical protein